MEAPQLSVVTQKRLKIELQKLEDPTYEAKHGVRLLKSTYDDWRLQLTRLDEGSKLAEDLEILKTHGIEGVTLCIRFSANYPITPPYLRITHPLVVVPCGNIYNNDTQNFNVNLWGGKWTPVNDVFSIVMLVRSTLASTNAYVNFEKSNLQQKKEETKTPNPKPEPPSPTISVPEVPPALAEYKKLAHERHKKKRTLEEMKVTDVVIKNLQVSHNQRANGLPCAPEVQGKILTYLSLQSLLRVQQVCKLWYRLAWESQVLLDLSKCGFPSPKYIDYVLAKLSLGNVETLNLGITPWRSPLCEPMTRLYQLSHLTWHVSSKPDLDLLKQFTTLRTLELHTKHYSFFNASTISTSVLPLMPPPLGPPDGEESEGDGEMEQDGEEKDELQSDDESLPLDEIADTLSLLSNLQNLNLPEVYMVRWRCLSKLPYLTSLQILKSPTLNDKEIKYLALCTNLVSLDLSFCEYITSVGAHHLTSLTNLRWLSLSGCVKVQSWMMLAHLPQLSGLKLNRTNLDSNAKVLYIPALTGLECLSLADNSSLTHYDINFLATLPQLKVLHLRGCNNLDGDSLAPLTNLHNLNVLTLKACNGLDHLDFVKYLSHLAVLDIAYCRQLRERSVVGLGEMSSLQKLKMSGLLLVPTQTKQSIKEKLKYSVVEF